FDFNIPMAPGDRLFWAFTITQGTGTGEPGDWDIPEDGEMSAEYLNKYRETYAKGLYLYRVFEKVVEKMLEGQTVFSTDNVFVKSDWLINKKDIVVTSQDALRGIENAVIKTSIRQLFNACRHWSASLGVENGKLFIEPFVYAFQSDLLVDLGEVAKCGLDTAEDLLFNTIKAGGPVVDYGDVNGKSEFTQEQTWKTTVTRSVVTLDLSTEWRRDPYGIEFARINFDGKTTTDDKSDNDVFMVNVQSNSEVNETGLIFQRLFRPTYTSLTGVIDPVGIFNVELSPKRTVLNNLSMINSILDTPMNGKLITLSTANKNRELATTGFSNVDEDEAIQVGSGAQPVFRPYYLTIETKVSQNILPLLELYQY
ncbi:MAG TPA: hypothetical protein VEA37_03775, partial [Flavobacterium sp.]|nr:hypothetical protein [Flavobacterium sp.]